MTSTPAQALAPLVALFVILYAFVLIIGGQRGARTARSRGAGAAGAIAEWCVGTLWRLGVVLVATAVDAAITVTLMAYRVYRLRRIDGVWDDAAAFLHRLNDRVFAILSR